MFMPTSARTRSMRLRRVIFASNIAGSPKQGTLLISDIKERNKRYPSSIS